MEKYKSSKKGICQNSIHGVDEACECDWWTQSDGSWREEDHHFCMVTEEPINLFDKPDKRRAGLSGSFCRHRCCRVCHKQVEMPHLIKKEGKVTVSWRTGLGAAKRPTFKVGRVSRTLISVDRLQKTGQDGTSHVVST